MTTTTTATTTTTRPAPPDAPAPDGYGATAIPLAEFGKSLSDADLDEWLEAFGQRNATAGQYEISPQGCLLIMPPTGDPGTYHELKIAVALDAWGDTHGGFVRGSSALFVLPNGAHYGPDASWVAPERQDEVRQGRRPFSHLVPDFIVEVQSPSNSRAELIAKINQFLAYGTRLAWLIDAPTRTVIKFRPGQEPEILHNPEYIDGDADVLPGFRFAVRQRIFDNPNNP